MDKDDDSQNYALAVVAGVVALVIALVIGVATWSVNNTAAPAAAAATAAPAGVTVVVEKIYFEVSSASLPAEANDVLIRVAEAVRAKPGGRVLISGFHDATGNAQSNAELAKERAMAVRHGLEANGVALEMLVMDKPTVTTGGVDEREARRVELTLQ